MVSTRKRRVADEVPPGTYVVVVGAANMDVKARSARSLVPRTSNPGCTIMSPGGVGRNIAENLARLGTPTQLITALGRDVLGDQLLRQADAAGVRLDHVHRSHASTGTYTAVLDSSGELVAAVADMASIAEIGVVQLRQAADLLAHARMLVLDANLGSESLSFALDVAAAHGVMVVLDPVSDPKAAGASPQLRANRPVFMVTPNRTELAVLSGLPTRTDRQIARAANRLHARGVANVWVRLGAAGSVLLSDERAPTTLSSRASVVRDVTGAGDAMTAAFVHAFLGGRPVTDAAAFGQAAAALTIASTETVRRDLTLRRISSELRCAQQLQQSQKRSMPT